MFLGGFKAVSFRKKGVTLGADMAELLIDVAEADRGLLNYSVQTISLSKSLLDCVRQIMLGMLLLLMLPLHWFCITMCCHSIWYNRYRSN